MSALLRMSIAGIALVAGSPAAAQEVQRELRTFALSFLREREAEVVTLPESPELESFPPVFEPFPPERVGSEDPQQMGPPSLDVESVLEAIRSFIDPDEWRNSRNEMELASGVLWAVHTPETLGRIERFLGQIEAHSLREATLDICLLPAEKLAEFLPGAMRPGAPPWIAGEDMERIAASAAESAVLLSAAAREGRPGRIGPESASLELEGWAVNRTGFLPAVHPDVRLLREGAYADFTILGAPGGGWHRVDLRLGLTRRKGDPTRRRTPGGDLDLMEEEHWEARTSAVVPRGKATVIGFLSRGGAEPAGAFPAMGAIVRVRPSRLGGPEPPGSVAHVIDCRMLFHEPYRRPAGDKKEPAEETSGAERAAAAILRELLPSAGDGKNETEGAGTWQGDPGGLVFIRADEERARAVRDRLDELARERSRVFAIDLWQGVATPAELSQAPRAGPLLEGSWMERMESRPGIRARLCAIPESSPSLGGIVKRGHLGEVKLAGAVKEIPVVALLVDTAKEASGLLLHVDAEAIPGMPWAQIGVRGESAGRPSFERRASPRTGFEPIEIELPEKATDRWRHLVTAPLGKPVLLNALPDPGDPSRTRVLVAVVTEHRVEQ